MLTWKAIIRVSAVLVVSGISTAAFVPAERADDMSCDLHCHDFVSENQHTATLVSGGTWSGPEHSAPLAKLCGASGGSHADWGGDEGFAIMDAIDAAGNAAHMSMAEIETVLAQYSDVLVINHERHALQVMDCVGDHVLAHFPLNIEPTTRSSRVVFSYAPARHYSEKLGQSRSGSAHWFSRGAYVAFIRTA